MDTLTIIALIIGACGLVGMAWLGGYELGLSNAKPVRAPRPTVTQLIDELNTRKPKSAKNQRKAVRKAVRA
jgi:hypothetical protein